MLTEGRNRQVRRMVAARGANVLRLVRVGIGGVLLGELEGADATTISVTVDPSTWTFIAVICGPSCVQINGTAYNASGKEIAKAPKHGFDAVIQIPPGNGASVDVKVDMLVCEWETCPYAIQTFTRPGS